MTHAETTIQRGGSLGERLGVSATAHDDIWIIAGSSDRPITLGVLAVVTTVVTGRSYYNNACLPCFFGCLAKRINRVTLEDRTSQREIDYANVVSGFQRDGARGATNVLTFPAWLSQR